MHAIDSTLEVWGFFPTGKERKKCGKWIKSGKKVIRKLMSGEDSF